eukprot:TRINITY_DN17357_c0_g1_i3.p1 TRINITY_DN17357_c0_g1~~TRINITY_DN17357_c0_g1_i3.p1  ORF type:complete len:491 (+),score=39.28 TRINITY_DN17357_c0_g1_i3:60-1475(+)
MASLATSCQENSTNEGEQVVGSEVPCLSPLLHDSIVISGERRFDPEIVADRVTRSGSEAQQSVFVCWSRGRVVATVMGVVLGVLGFVALAAMQSGSNGFIAPYRFRDLVRLITLGNTGCALSRCNFYEDYAKDGYTCFVGGHYLGKDCGDVGCAAMTDSTKPCWILASELKTVHLTEFDNAWQFQCADGFYFSDTGFCLGGVYDHACQDPGCGPSTSCFPGHALVEVRGRGPIPVASVNVGDEVLVAKGVEVVDMAAHASNVIYEPVLAFLHALRDSSPLDFITIVHSRGELRVSENHLVFAALAQNNVWAHRTGAVLRPGDRLLAVSSAEVASSVSEIVAIHRNVTRAGMFAPLTMAGTIVVDGVVASIYAAPALDVHLDHPSAHAAIFPVRAYHALKFGEASAAVWSLLCGDGDMAGFGRNTEALLAVLCQGDGLPAAGLAEDRHPLVRLFQDYLRLDLLLAKVRQAKR